MTSLCLALVLLAAAVPLWSASTVARARLAAVGGMRSQARTTGGRTPSTPCLAAVFASSVGALLGVLCGWPYGLPVGGVGAAVAWLVVRRFLGRGNRSRLDPTDQLGVAATWDLLAASLRAGLPVPTAVRAVADDLPPEAAAALRATADLLALGADPVAAWAPALDCPATAELARGARRTARSGAALAGAASALASGIRAAASDVAEARAQRAGVLITGPLGLCFLPAFVCLGIVPVVVGLAAQLSVHP
ncbi:MAG TPA: type II secretion system F family protein [Actinophytocola sp.]|uniref:type II secretion system F family protein n=1 Tax=Actinophytocola sp. TaxID=1872138 RepID=UPI002DDDA368|nr:type II secretion system F family protein [Actinophytocola sp.]HEV2779021.1 type II secretion system F family protein [Actinophytocola sp.]